MGEKLKVNITASATVRYSKTVEMEKDDYDFYLEICRTQNNGRELDRSIEEIAFKYGFEPSIDNIEDADDPEDIEFEVIK